MTGSIHAGGKGGNIPFVAPARQLVAVKQLKPAVLGDEQELHGFIAETDGGCPPVRASSARICHRPLGNIGDLASPWSDRHSEDTQSTVLLANVMTLT